MVIVERENGDNEAGFTCEGSPREESNKQHQTMTEIPRHSCKSPKTEPKACTQSSSAAILLRPYMQPV